MPDCAWTWFMKASNWLQAAPTLPPLILLSVFCSRLFACWKLSIAAWAIKSEVICAGLRTVTEKLPDAPFPWASLAEQLTVVVPITNVALEVGAHVTSTDPFTMSVANAV